MYPFRTLLGQALRSGELPYWNPHTFLGSPFLANPISATFYPPNWMFLLLPVRWAWSLQFPLRLGLAAFFAAMFARRVGASQAGALLGGFVFCLSGFMTAWQGWPQADCMLWAPLILLCLIEIARHPTARRAALLALAASMPLLAGHPEVCLYTLSTVGAFGFFCLIRGLRRGRSATWALRYVGALLLGASLAVGLCAVQLIPSGEWISRITRTLDRPWGPFPARAIVALLSRDARSTPSPTGVSVPEQCCYVGLCTLLLVPLAFHGRRRSIAIFFALLGIVAAEITFGLFPASQLFRALPQIRALPGNRILGVLDLSLAVLASLGFSNLERRGLTRRSVLIGILGITTICLGLGIGVLGGPFTGKGRFGPWVSPASTLIFLTASGAILVWTASRKQDSPYSRILIVLTLGLDLISFSWGHVPFVEARTVFPDAPLFRFLESYSAQHDRVLFLSPTAPANVEIMYGLKTVSGYPQVLRETARLLSPLNGGSEHDEPLGKVRADAVASADPRLIDLLGIRWIIASKDNDAPESRSRLQERFPNWLANGSLRIYENPTAIPLAFVVPGDGVKVEAPELDWERLPDDFDPRRTVSLDRRPHVTGTAAPLTAAAVTILHPAMNSVAGEVSVTATSVLVMTQTWYPGWHASLDGRDTDVLRADRTFCAMIVPPGTHRFLFSFYPTHFSTTVTISGLTLCAVAAALTRRRRSLPLGSQNRSVPELKES